ncbi:hypothetical protein EBQ25_09370 [Allofranklinella schreckenbergeri]|uniref:Uncharacterized protein n=1 Tax=Allofranklinella schreckenbergeri TaxID=1076744 RepID=A0A3M6Q5N4_9BURK|nr:hypothetical protein EBQ25_09370 [Allofranklinella schreckenbergeri]
MQCKALAFDRLQALQPGCAARGRQRRNAHAGALLPSGWPQNHALAALPRQLRQASILHPSGGKKSHTAHAPRDAGAGWMLPLPPRHRQRQKTADLQGLSVFCPVAFRYDRRSFF